MGIVALNHIIVYKLLLRLEFLKLLKKTVKKMEEEEDCCSCSSSSSSQVRKVFFFLMIVIGHLQMNLISALNNY